MKDDSRYALRGVSSGKEEVHKAIKKIDKGLFPKALQDSSRLFNWQQRSLCGNACRWCWYKIIFTYAYWKETGDLLFGKGLRKML